MKRLALVMCLMLTGCSGPEYKTITYVHEIQWVTGVYGSDTPVVQKFYTDDITYRGWDCIEFIDKVTGKRVRLVSTNMCITSSPSESGE